MSNKEKNKGKKKIGKFDLTTNIELMHMAEIYKFELKVLSKDQLKDIPKKERPGNYIINLQNIKDGNGTHWVSLIIYPKPLNISFYYDSFGILPPLEVIYFVNSGKNIAFCEMYICNKQIQNIYDGFCGQYCIDFLRYMNKEYQKINPLKRFDKYLELWSNRRV